jgi:alpha-glucosidase
MKAAVDRTAQYQIPHDVQYGDIDIMERELDFTYSKDRFAGLPEYIKELKTKGIKFMTILDPCISIGEPAGSYRPFDYGEELGGVWVKRADGSNAVGRVWPDDPVYFPDYSMPTTREWWITLIKEFHDLLEYDGLWIDMNEPANFVTGDVNGCNTNNWNNPPYTPKIRGGYLPAMTICADHKDHVGNHYDTHSLFGWFQSEPTLTGTRAGTGKRALVLSRSTFLGSGHWAAHWLGDNWSRWSNLHFSIIGMLQYNQFGIPFVGSDICGFIGNTNADMCQRWMELGAFYPFSRNHNGYENENQDPGFFGPEVAESSRKALLVRYTLLPYLYTLFYQHHVNGNTVVRAIWHEFPTDAQAVGIDRQFFWGSGLLISPVLDEGALEVLAYFPDARFYDYYTGAERSASTKGQYSTIAAPKDYIPLHVRGGNILPTQEPAVNTEISRNNPLGLIVALDEFSSAFGSLYYDDGDSIDPVQNNAYFYTIVSAANRSIRNSIVQDGYPGMASKTIDTVRLLGAGAVSAVTVNGAPHTDFSTLPGGEVLIRNLGIRANSAFVITY